MSESLKLESAGRPKHPRWDEMNDIDKYLKLCFMIAQSIATGKWKKVPPHLHSTMERLREGLANKYPDYFKLKSVQQLEEQPVPEPVLPPVEKESVKLDEPKFTTGEL